MRATAALSLLAISAPAAAGGLSVDLRTPGGAPVRDAVVSLYPAGKPAAFRKPPGTYEIVQKDIKFTPFVLLVPVGAEIAFPNQDNVRHHVYSFSPAKRFELKLYAREQSRRVRFDRAGAVPLGCNIHDGMSAFVKVSDTALAVQTDRSGNAAFANVPPGPVTARIWHPYLRAPGNQVEIRWQVPSRGAARQTVTIHLRPVPRVRSGY